MSENSGESNVDKKTSLSEEIQQLTSQLQSLLKRRTAQQARLSKIDGDCSTITIKLNEEKQKTEEMLRKKQDLENEFVYQNDLMESAIEAQAKKKEKLEEDIVALNEIMKQESEQKMKLLHDKEALASAVKYAKSLLSLEIEKQEKLERSLTAETRILYEKALKASQLTTEIDTLSYSFRSDSISEDDGSAFDISPSLMQDSPLM